MANDNKPNPNPVPSKKEIKRQVAGKIETALPEMRTTLGEKKFHRRVKKAVKLIMQGIHSDEVLKKAKKKADITRAASIKKATTKKVKDAKKVKKAKAAMPEIFD